MKNLFSILLSGTLLSAGGCQTESLTIQRTFPITLQLDAFPASIARNQPTTVGFGVRPAYLTAGNTFTFSWQLAAPSRATLLVDKRVVGTGQKVLVQPRTDALLGDTLTYVPSDSGQHLITLRVVDDFGQRKDTTFTVLVK